MSHTHVLRRVYHSVYACVLFTNELFFLYMQPADVLYILVYFYISFLFCLYAIYIFLFYFIFFTQSCMRVYIFVYVYCCWQQCEFPHCGSNKSMAHLTTAIYFIPVRGTFYNDVLVTMHRYLPPALQEVADIVVSFRHQMKCLPNDLLLHVLRLQHMWHSSPTALETWPEFGSCINYPDAQPLLKLPVLIFTGW